MVENLAREYTVEAYHRAAMSGRFVLEHVSGPRELIKAARQIRRLVNEDPVLTAFMVHRASDGGPGGTPRCIESVPLAQISPYLICAVIGAEDPLFFQHNGFWWNQVKIVLIRRLLKKEPLRAVSTITQQLARNLFLSPCRSVRRKLAEAAVTWQLERVLTKQRILELYLNVIEWGVDLWGIASAAQVYCGSEPRNLSPFQSAVLVSLLPAPRAQLIAANAQRALAVQRRLPRFLYSAGLLSVAQEKHVQMSAIELAKLVNSGTPLPQAMRRLNRNAPNANEMQWWQQPTVQDLLSHQCGWDHRLRFEEFLRSVRSGDVSFDSRPMWWTEPSLSANSISLDKTPRAPGSP